MMHKDTKFDSKEFSGSDNLRWTSTEDLNFQFDRDLVLAEIFQKYYVPMWQMMMYKHATFVCQNISSGHAYGMQETHTEIVFFSFFFFFWLMHHVIVNSILKSKI